VVASAARGEGCVAGDDGGGGCAAKGAWDGGSAHGGEARVRGGKLHYLC
jgi:hypothetical protein